MASVEVEFGLGAAGGTGIREISFRLAGLDVGEGADVDGENRDGAETTGAGG